MGDVTLSTIDRLLLSPVPWMVLIAAVLIGVAVCAVRSATDFDEDEYLETHPWDEVGDSVERVEWDFPVAPRDGGPHGEMKLR